MSELLRQTECETLDDLARELLRESPETALTFLRQAWLSGSVQTLIEARRRAGLTQQEVSERLNTTQSAIARLENDDEGKLSLRRFVDYLVACDMLPFDIEVASASVIRNFAIAEPGSPKTMRHCVDWAQQAHFASVTYVRHLSRLPVRPLLSAPDLQSLPASTLRSRMTVGRSLLIDEAEALTPATERQAHVA